MRFRNTSRYDPGEVRRLVEFATAGIDTERVAVNVKNCRHSYRGRAYFGVPACSPWSRDAGVDRLVTIGLGASEKFPCDNLTARARWLRVDPGVPTAGERLRRRTRVVNGRREVWQERCVVERHPYGGKRSAYIRVADWREALVAVAAHEARHLWQERNGKPRSEVDCERYAAARLEEYRRGIVP